MFVCESFIDKANLALVKELYTTNVWPWQLPRICKHIKPQAGKSSWWLTITIISETESKVNVDSIDRRADLQSYNSSCSRYICRLYVNNKDRTLAPAGLGARNIVIKVKVTGLSPHSGEPFLRLYTVCDNIHVYETLLLLLLLVLLLL